MNRSWGVWVLAIAGLAGGALLLVPGQRPSAQSPGAPVPAKDQAPKWRSRWETLKAEVVARLDELDQREDELVDQKAAVKKAEVAFGRARRELEVAERALREYEEGTARQERDQAEGELALAQADYKLAAARPAHAAPAAEGEPPPSPGTDDQLLARARLTAELARLKRDTLVNLAQPRRSAELARDVAHAKDEVALKQAALDQEKTDEKRLRKLLRDDALEPEERRSLARLAEISRLAGSPKDPAGPDARKAEIMVDEASALWTGADRSRASRRDTALRLRLLRASEGGAARAE
ncbi:MAG: hypothetical protein P4L84_18465 [Isosphaeraceae bacterium]|nr:hypothetical protein [Isosphaeraceae bacterium]